MLFRSRNLYKPQHPPLSPGGPPTNLRSSLKPSHNSNKGRGRGEVSSNTMTNIIYYLSVTLRDLPDEQDTTGGCSQACDFNAERGVYIFRLVVTLLFLRNPELCTVVWMVNVMMWLTPLPRM